MSKLNSLVTFMKNNPIRSFVLALILLTPLFLYFFKFHNGLSSNETSWATFGTFIGGVYGPLFTFASVIVLVATLLEINESNRKNFEFSQNKNIINEIIELTKILDISLKNNIIFCTEGRLKNINWLNSIIKSRFAASPPSDEQEIWDASIDKFVNNEIELFSDQIHILREILIRIHNIEDSDLKESAQSIFKSMIPNYERFWLECFIHRFHKDIKLLIALWPSFSVLPHALYSLIEQPEDVNP